MDQLDISDSDIMECILDGSIFDPSFWCLDEDNIEPDVSDEINLNPNSDLNQVSF